MRPVLEAALERLFDQQAAKARAVDEQVRSERRASLDYDMLDEPVCRAQLYIDDFGIDASHTPRFGVAAQIGRI
jgi:hypothetical protein